MVKPLLERSRGCALLLALGVALAWSSAVPAEELEPFVASYEWLWHGMTVAVSTLELRRQDENWLYSSRSEPRGIGRMFSERPTQASLIRLTATGAQPLSYRADDGTPSTERDADVHFDWARGRVTGVYEDTPVDLPTRAGLQDDMSVQIALMVELLQGRTPGQLALLDRNAIREYSYTADGKETLATALGAVPTLIYKSHKAGSPRVTRFWCAPGYGFIPMRVEQKRIDEVEWTMRIRSLKRNP